MRTYADEVEPIRISTKRSKKEKCWGEWLSFSDWAAAAVAGMVPV